MLKEAMQFLFDRCDEMAKAKNRVNVLKEFTQHPAWVCYELNGEVQSKVVYPRPVSDEILFLQDIPLVINRYSEIDSDPAEPSVWITQECIIVHLGGHNFAKLRLNKTDVWEKLESLDNHETGRMDQQAILRLLRRDFRKAQGADVALSAIRNLKFRKTSQVGSRMDHGSESLGSDIEAEVAGLTSPIPDLLKLQTPVFCQHGEQVEVELDLEVLVHDQKFALRPMPDAVQRGIETALVQIKEVVLGMVDCPVLMGSPTIGSSAI